MKNWLWADFDSKWPSPLFIKTKNEQLLLILLFFGLRWDREGIEGLLYDDGIDRGEDVPERTRRHVGANDIYDAMETKYTSLRKKLLLEMLRRDAGLWVIN